jgi:hypothetical protein
VAAHVACLAHVRARHAGGKGCDNALRTPPTAEQYLNNYVNTTYAPPVYPEGTAVPVALGASRLREAKVHVDAVAGGDPLHHPVEHDLPVIRVLRQWALNP